MKDRWHHRAMGRYVASGLWREGCASKHEYVTEWCDDCLTSLSTIAGRGAALDSYRRTMTRYMMRKPFLPRPAFKRRKR